MKPNKERLEFLYIEKKNSPEKIAELYNVSGRTIRNWLNEYGIPRLGPSHLRKGKSAVWNVGIVRTPEERKKNSQAHLGKVPGNYGTGRVTFACEVCGKDVFDKPYRKKRTCSKECKDKLLHIQRGTGHWNFKGGDAGFRQRMRNWSQYREWRTAVLKRADYTCAKCKQRGGRLTSHHLSTWNNHPESRFDPLNGACACWKCHWAFHKEYGHHNTTPEMFADWLTR